MRVPEEELCEVINENNEIVKRIVDNLKEIRYLLGIGDKGVDDD